MLERCMYCKKDLQPEKGISVWDPPEHHYKLIHCDCGRKNWMRVDFIGSGHDYYLKKYSPLESMIRKVQEK